MNSRPFMDLTNVELLGKLIGIEIFLGQCTSTEGNRELIDKCYKEEGRLKYEAQARGLIT